MFAVGNTNYPLCLLDTMAVSEMVKRPNGAFRRHFLEWSVDVQPMFVPCFTVYTLMELRRKPALFATFVEQFHSFPCVMLKGYAQLLEEEVASYPDPSGIDPCGIAFTPLGGEGNLLSNLPILLDLPEHNKQEQGWNKAGPEIVAGMASLVENYPPAGDTYTAKEVRYFVWQVSFEQLVLHGHSEFAERVLNLEGEEVEMDSFPSLKAMTYTVFHKFYADRYRKAADSDAFDVLIAAALPYVEAVITEVHLAESLRKTKHRDDLFDDLHIFTLRDFRTAQPVTPVLSLT
jgi:hypothetical protein